MNSNLIQLEYHFPERRQIYIKKSYKESTQSPGEMLVQEISNGV